MNHAQLINRGEQFVVDEGSTRFEGECVWSWKEIPGEMPRPVYPIRIFVQSIRRRGISGLLPLSRTERLRIAIIAKQLLEAREVECEVVLDPQSPVAHSVGVLIGCPLFIAGKIDHLDEIDDSDRFAVQCIYAEGGPNAVPTARAFICADDEGSIECPSDPTLSHVLMVQQAKECIEVWSEWRDGRKPDPRDKFAAVMFYSRNDAWLPVE